MNRVFHITQGFTIPDGTMVYPFLNSRDVTSGLPWDILDDISLAVGDIAPRSRSKIHVHPFVTLVTWVVSGTLQIRMKELENPIPFTVSLTPQQAAITRPGTFLQHINMTNELCRVLYIVSPAYLFVTPEAEYEGYDDAAVTDLDWEDVERQHWYFPALANLDATREARARAIARLKA